MRFFVRILAVGAFFIAAAGGAQAMSRIQKAQIDAALVWIRTASGESAAARLSSCGIRIRPESYLETLVSDVPAISAKRGDTDMELMVDLPRPPWFDPAQDSAESYQNILMRWTIKKGGAMPTSAWAEKLEHARPPMVSDSYLNC